MKRILCEGTSQELHRLVTWFAVIVTLAVSLENIGYSLPEQVQTSVEIYFNENNISGDIFHKSCNCYFCFPYWWAFLPNLPFIALCNFNIIIFKIFSLRYIYILYSYWCFSKSAQVVWLQLFAILLSL